MNGLRPWRENRLAICLAQEWSKPIVSGGDRHALQPNVVLNFTQAATFAEFAQEIRDGLSNVFVTGHYRQSHTSRIIHNVLDVLQPYEQHGLGWREWPDRVFYQVENGVARSVRELWGDNPPRAIRIFDSMVQFAGHGSIRNAMRAVSSRAQQVIV